jgi:glyoxylase-like metal-dependent hydrolase (beta-lactamase superfamily II)
VRVICLPAYNPGPYTGGGNSTYLLTGREPLLVDAGVGDARHLDELAAALAGQALARVVVTHNHSDHAKGVEGIAARWPGASLLKKPWPERDARYAAAWARLGDGDRVPAGDGWLRAIETPGHAPDHVCLWDSEARVLFGGDLLVRDGTVVIPATHGGSLSQYLRSLEKVLALAPARVLPAHGPPIENPDVVIRRYLAHRRAREVQILRALEEGHRDLDAMVPQVYGALRPEIADAARESVLAHLVKLQEEGRATRDEGGRWTIKKEGRTED